MKTFLVDMDNTMVDMTKGVLTEYNKRTGENVQSKDIVDYNFENCVKHPDHISNIIHSRGFFAGLEPFPGVVFYMNALIKSKVDVLIVTQPTNTDYCIPEKRQWVKTHIPAFDLKNMIFCHRKENITGHVLFDDAPKHLRLWPTINGGITCKILFPYNKHVDTSYTLSLETAWPTFFKLANKLNA